MSEMLMRRETADDYGFKKLQNKILEIAVDLDELCRRNDIEYYIMGGTALGAKRHGGFIPWDDDLDIFMTPDNYDRFKACFYEQIDKAKYHLQEWRKNKDKITIAKVRMNNTTYIEPILKEKHIHQGVFIDIFILHNCPNGLIQQSIQFIWAKYIVVQSLAHRGYIRRGGIIGIVLKIMKKLPKNFLTNYAMKQVYKYRGKSTYYYCNFLGKALFKKGIYPKVLFGKPRDVNFETVTLKAPEKLEEFLKYRFGDYMKIPSPERIKWEQHAEIFDIEKDYSFYLNYQVPFEVEEDLI